MTVEIHEPANCTHGLCPDWLRSPSAHLFHDAIHTFNWLTFFCLNTLYSEVDNLYSELLKYKKFKNGRTFITASAVTYRKLEHFMATALTV